METIDKDLLKELIELRHIASDKEHIQRSNHYYIVQISSLEIELNELRSELQAKEQEIFRIRKKLSGLDSFEMAQPDTDQEGLKTKLALLEEENNQLQNLKGINNEMERLKHQLQITIDLKKQYEEKYQDAILRLRRIESEDSEFYKDDNNLIEELNQQIENLQAENLYLREQIQMGAPNYQKIKFEYKMMKSTQYAQLEEQVNQLKIQKQRMLAEQRFQHQELMQQYKEVGCQTQAQTIKSILQTRLQTSSPITPLINSSKMSRQRLRKKPMTSPKSTNFEMFNTFRSKQNFQSAPFLQKYLLGRRTVNSYHQTHTRKLSQSRSGEIASIKDSFADNFPMEDELIQ